MQFNTFFIPLADDGGTQLEEVQVYTIMTNEQLAEMVRRDIHDLEVLREIEGVGSSRIEKYGGALLEVLNEDHAGK